MQNRYIAAMSATQIIAEIERMPVSELEQVYSAVALKLAREKGVSGADLYARKMTFDEARELIFRENKEAYHRLAQ